MSKGSTVQLRLKASSDQHQGKENLLLIFRSERANTQFCDLFKQELDARGGHRAGGVLQEQREQTDSEDDASVET